MATIGESRKSGRRRLRRLGSRPYLHRQGGDLAPCGEERWQRRSRFRIYAGQTDIGAA